VRVLMGIIILAANGMSNFICRSFHLGWSVVKTVPNFGQVYIHTWVTELSLLLVSPSRINSVCAIF